MNSNSLVSISDISKEEIMRLLRQARYFEKHPNHKILEGRVVATLFFEPSTRTRLSFETAVNRLGGRVIFTRHLKLLACDEVECGIEILHSHEQRVYSTSVFQVTWY